MGTPGAGLGGIRMPLPSTLPSFLSLFYFCLICTGILSECMLFVLCACSDLRSQKRALDFLELELQTVAGSMWVLESNPLDE